MSSSTEMNERLVADPNEAVITEFRANSGTVTQAMGGALATLDLILLHHRGRKSGRMYTTPVAYMPYEDGYLLLGSFAGAPAEPLWVGNLENTAELTVETGTRTRTMTAAVLRNGPERDRLYAAARAHWPFVPGYEQRTARPFPVIRLTPAD